MSSLSEMADHNFFSILYYCYSLNIQLALCWSSFKDWLVLVSWKSNLIKIYVNKKISRTLKELLLVFIFLVHEYLSFFRAHRQNNKIEFISKLYHYSKNKNFHLYFFFCSQHVGISACVSCR